MGREIRKVIANWEHPMKKEPCYQTGTMVDAYAPLYDKCVDDAWDDWHGDYESWLDKEFHETMIEHPDLGYDKTQPYSAFCDWYGTPPEPKYYRPKWNKQDMTWFQAYETVSEGTPVTPAFESEDELIDYLVENGDFWDQKRRKQGTSIMPCDPWPRESAEKFVKGSAYVPSMIMSNGTIKTGVEALADL